MKRDCNRIRTTPKVFSWTPEYTSDLMWEDPDGRNLVLGDVLVIEKGQSVRFRESGQTIWYREPGSQNIGIFGINQQKMLESVARGRTLEGLQFATSIVFIKLENTACMLQAGETISISNLISVRPSFRVEISVENDVVFADSFQPGTALSQVTGAMMIKADMWMRSFFPSVFHIGTSDDDAKLLLNSLDFQGKMEMELLKTLKEDLDLNTRWGIGIDHLDFVDWNIQYGKICPYCGKYVEVDDLGRCPVHLCKLK